MYYVLAVLFFIIVYFALTKILSSLLKGCLVTLGIFLLVVGGYVFLKSTKEPVVLFDTYVIDNFKVTKIENLKDEVVKGIINTSGEIIEKRLTN